MILHKYGLTLMTFKNNLLRVKTKKQNQAFITSCVTQALT